MAREDVTLNRLIKESYNSLLSADKTVIDADTDLLLAHVRRYRVGPVGEATALEILYKVGRVLAREGAK